jgi:nitroreductase
MIRDWSMDTLQAISSRRSVKHYDPDHRMPEADLRKLLELALLSPTAFNIQHWRFVVVQDAALRKEIRAVAWDQAQVTDASALIILCGDAGAWKRDPSRYWKDAPEAVRSFLVPAIGQYYDGRPEVQRDEVMRSAGMAGQTLMLAAKAMGYDSCPMDGFDFEKVAELIRLPDEHVIAFMVAIGKKTQDAWPRPGQLAYEEVVIQDRFP